ncbi:MAG: oligosaccharide flippase family protein, partial [Bacteroidota bacterium]|nr:oligosaccharide flippase family protein [Bacteroidota bacterium]
LYFYPVFLKEQYYGLVVFLLATSNLLQPLISFGSQHTIIKYFRSYNSAKEKDVFMSSIIFLPIITIIPICYLVVQFHDVVANFLSLKNPIIEGYVWVIFLVAFATSYFEVFYSWARVQLKSVFGNFLKEIYPRVSIFILLLLVFFDIISKENFVWYLTGFYYLRLLIMIVYSLKLYTPKLYFKLPANTKQIILYSIYIFLAGSAASILIDIDKFMIPQKEAISQTAFYAVAVFIATVVEIPGRALFQIVNPLVAKALNTDNFTELRKLYKESSLNLLIISGLFFLLINLNIVPFYELMDNPSYGTAVWVVLMISLSKLILMSFGCGPAILATSKFYKITLPFSIGMALSVYFLNDYLIDLMGINGAALSTLIVVAIFTFLKIIYIKSKLNLSPYSFNSVKTLLIIGSLFLIFENISFPFEGIGLIIINSLITVLAYTLVVYYSNLSGTLNKFIMKVLTKLRF